MDTHGMLPNVREHSFLVRHVAEVLGQALINVGFDLHLPLVVTGALLHDLGKTPCLGTLTNHAAYGADLLVELGYVEVAAVVRQHVYLEAEDVDAPMVREAEVVNYADKRVLHDRIVTLAARFADLQERYGRTPEARGRIEATRVRTELLEAKLFEPLSLTPQDLLNLNHLRSESWENCVLPSSPAANPRSGKSR